MEESTTSRRFSRRTIAKGAAWSVPAVAVATPARAAATSGPIVPSFSPGTFCKHPSAGRYHAVFCFNNTTDAAITVTLGTFNTPNSGNVQGYFSNGTDDTAGGLVTTKSIPSGEHCYYVDSALVSNQANGVATLNFSYVYAGATVNGSVSTDNPPPQGITPCGTNPATDQPTDDPAHIPSQPPIEP